MLLRVKVHVRFLDDSYHEVGRSEDTPLLSGSLAAHQTTCFLASTVNREDFATYVVEIASVTTGGHPARNLTISDLDPGIDPYYGWFRLTGSVR